MKKICNLLLSVFVLASFLNHLATFSQAQGRSVYFQRVTNEGGVLSSIPVTGPATAIKDIVKGFSGSLAGGLTPSGDGNIFLADYEHNRILIANKSGSFTEVVSSAAGLSLPTTISYDQTNKFLYISDSTPGSQRIVRANLNGTFPVTSVEVVVSPGSLESIVISDIKYNQIDNKLYWTSAGTFYRSDVNTQSLPVSTIDTLTTTDTNIIPTYFDFSSNAASQEIFFINLDSTNQGIYKAAVPASGNTNLSEFQILNQSSNPEATLLGLAVDSQSNSLCYSYFSGTTQKLFCGDRDNLISASEIADNGIFSAFLYLIIDESLSAVTPSTQPAAPAISVTVSGAKPQALLTFEAFSGAVTSKTALLRALKEAAKNKPKAKLGFQYYAEIKRPTDAAGVPIPKKQQDLRKLTTKKNQLAVKNLKTNSNYEVKYRVEITSKTGNSDPKVVKKTPFSPTTGFTIQ